jgi:hypothetical protein
MNRCPRIEPGAMRLGCTSLLVVYSIIVAVRLEESHGTFLLLRLAVCAYAAFGIWLSGHVTWRSIRAYTVGLAFLLPLQAGYVDAMLGNHVGDVTITALATFVPLVFLQTARDTVVVALGLGIGHGMILASAPTPAVPLPFVGMLLGGVIATGTTAGLHALLYRGRWTPASGSTSYGSWSTSSGAGWTSRARPDKARDSASRCPSLHRIRTERWLRSEPTPTFMRGALPSRIRGNPSSRVGHDQW